MICTVGGTPSETSGPETAAVSRNPSSARTRIRAFVLREKYRAARLTLPVFGPNQIGRHVFPPSTA